MKEGSENEGVGEKVAVLEKDIKLLKEKKEAKEKLTSEIAAKKREHLEEIKEMESKLKKFETDISGKLEQKRGELKRVLEEAAVQVRVDPLSYENRWDTLINLVTISFGVSSYSRWAATRPPPRAATWPSCWTP